MRILFITFLIVITLEPSVFSQQPFSPYPFSLPPDYTAGNQSTSVTYGDFNKDNKLDVAIGNMVTSSITMMLGNGNGTFTISTVNGSTYITDLITDDFNNDGNPDIAACNYLSNNASLCLGRGDGTFQRLNVFVGTSLRKIVSADFNHDNNKDLAFVGEDINKLIVVLGNGDGTFKPPVNYVTTAGPVSIIAGDFNGDTHADLIVSGYQDNTMYIHLGTGDGTFQPRLGMGFSPSMYNMVTADIDKDGDLDFMGADGGYLQIFTNNGNGVFTKPAAIQIGLLYIYDVVLKDLNNDLILDLISINKAGIITSFLGNGDGSFQNGTTYATGNIPRDFVIGDFNSDNIEDAVTISGGSYSLIPGLPDGKFESVLVTMGSGPIVSYDINNDAKSDIIYSVNEQIIVALGNGEATFQKIPSDYNFLGSLKDLVEGDFNEDGYIDIVGCTQYKTFIMLGKTGGAFQNPVDIGPASGLLDTIDINKDNHIDLVASGYIYWGNGNGTFSSQSLFFLGGSISFADLNNDGHKDLITIHSSGDGSSDQVIVYISKGNGSFKNARYYYLGVANPRTIATGDFNKDGFADVAITSGAGISVFLTNPDGSGTLGPKVNYTLGTYTLDMIADDYNGDGNLDLIVACSNDIRMRAGKGDGTFGPLQQIRIVQNPMSIKFGDFNDDRKKDLVVSGGGIAVMLNNTPYNSVSTLAMLPRICAGSVISIPYSTFGTFSNTNTFQAQLSSANGDFNNPVNISLPVQSNTSGSLDVIIQSTISDGENYKIRVIASDPFVSFYESKSLAIDSQLPTQSVSFVAADTVCTSTKRYSVSSQTEVLYRWTLLDGGLYSSDQNVIDVTWNKVGGPYSLSCTPYNGCGNGLPFSANIVVKTVPARPLNITPEIMPCKGTHLFQVVKDPEADFYKWTVPSFWQGASDSSSISLTGPIYNYSSYLSVAANNECGVGEALWKELLPTGYVEKPVLSSIGDSLITIANTSTSSFLWKRDGLVIDGNLPSIKVTQEGDYRVIVTNKDNGCKDSSGIVKITIVTSYRQSESRSKLIDVYPNPSSGIFNIVSDGLDPMEISVENFQGYKVFSKTLKTNVTSFPLDLSELAPAMYILSIKSARGNSIEKIIIE